VTYQQAAQTAIDCQDACNLSGVAKSLAGPVMDALWAEARRLERGTEWINQHPIVTLMIDKLASLNRTDCSVQSWSKAHAEVEAIVAVTQSCA